MRYFLYSTLLLSSFLIVGCSGGNENSIQVGGGTGIVYNIQDLQNQIQDKKEANYEKIYDGNKSIENLRLLVDYLRSDFQYDKAAKYFQELMSQSNDWDRKKLLQIISNDLDPQPGHYEKVSAFLDQYNNEGKINGDDYAYYKFTLSLLSGDFNKNDINNLSGNYTDFKNSLRKQFDLYYSYKDVPEYYRTALFAIAYFKHQDLGIAKSLANKALESNPQYILPYQIKTYVGILTKDFTGSKNNLDILLQIDQGSSERYQFLLGLAYFGDKQYNQAKNFFIQMKSPNLEREALRYLLFIERSLQGEKKNSIIDEHDKIIVRYTERLFSIQGLKSIDFQTLFDRYCYDRITIGSGGLASIYTLYSQYPLILNTAVEICPSVLTGNQYVCDYGKGILELLKGNTDGSLKKLIPLVKKYPQRQLYYLIGLLYKQEGLLENAKVYFGKSLQYIDVGQKKQMSDMMLELLNKAV